MYPEMVDQGPRSRVSRLLRELTVELRPAPGEYPGPEEYREIRLPSGAAPPGERTWADQGYFWEAGAAYHRPIYFEDLAVERHGRTRCEYLQPALSTARFYGQVAALPVCLVAQPPWSCRYTYGYGPPELPATEIPTGPCGRGQAYLKLVSPSLPPSAPGAGSAPTSLPSEGAASTGEESEDVGLDSNPPSALFSAPKRPLATAIGVP